MSDADLQSLRAYLADRDAPCSSCGYNLRGAQEPVCPECGGAIELSVAGNDRGRGYWILLMFALAWMAISGGMDATRAGRLVDEQSRPLPPFASFLTFSGNASVRLGGSIGSQTVIINGKQVRGSSPIVQGSNTLTPVSLARTRAWSLVGWASWLRLGSSGLVAVAGLAGLAALVVWRRRIMKLGPGRPLLTIVAALALVHVSVQVLLFVRELAF